MSDAYLIAELRRLLTNLARIGTVVAVNYAKASAKVDFDGFVSGWLPCPALMGRNWRGANPMREGTQVLVVSPCGDPAQGVIAAVIHRDSLPPSSDNPDIDQIRFNEGTAVTYVPSRHTLTVDAVGNVTVNTTGLARVDARDISLHASQSYSWDVDGYGQRITSNGGGSYTIHTWQQGASVSTTISGIKPPEGP